MKSNLSNQGKKFFFLTPVPRHLIQPPTVFGMSGRMDPSIPEEAKIEFQVLRVQSSGANSGARYRCFETIVLKAEIRAPGLLVLAICQTLVVERRLGFKEGEPGFGACWGPFDVLNIL